MFFPAGIFIPVAKLFCNVSHHNSFSCEALMFFSNPANASEYNTFIGKNF